jgi:hypothetical protein
VEKEQGGDHGKGCQSIKTSVLPSGLGKVTQAGDIDRGFGVSSMLLGEKFDYFSDIEEGCSYVGECATVKESDTVGMKVEDAREGTD